jgi:hypothetical protein
MDFYQGGKTLSKLNLHESRGRVLVEPHRHHVGVGLVERKQNVHRLLVVLSQRQESRQVAVAVGPRHHVHSRVLLQDLVLQAFGHAPQNPHLEPGAVPRPVLVDAPQVIQPIPYFLLGAVPNRTRHYQHHVGLQQLVSFDVVI